MFPGSRDGKTLLIEEALDFENGLDIFAAVEAMSAGALHRLQRGEFAFPEAQDESLGFRQTADFADAEQALFRNFARSLCSTRHGFSVS